MNDSSSPSRLYPSAQHHDETLSSGYAAPGGGTHRMNPPFSGGGGVDTSQTSYNINYSQAPGTAGGVFHQGRPSNPFARN